MFIQAKGPNNQIQFTAEILKGTEFKRGSIIINTTADTIGSIEAIVAPGVVEVDSDFYTSSTNGDAIIIYANENEGCIIYIGNTANGANISVETASGQEVVYKNVPQGGFLPVQVVRVNDSLTTVEDLIANW